MEELIANYKGQLKSIKEILIDLETDNNYGSQYYTFQGARTTLEMVIKDLEKLQEGK